MSFCPEGSLAWVWTAAFGVCVCVLTLVPQVPRAWGRGTSHMNGLPRGVGLTGRRLHLSHGQVLVATCKYISWWAPRCCINMRTLAALLHMRMHTFADAAYVHAYSILLYGRMQCIRDMLYIGMGTLVLLFFAHGRWHKCTFFCQAA